MTDGLQRLPYPGLRAFDRQEADLFFGRDGAVNEMIDKLAETGFLAVIGASGTGKSSLVRTGLLDGLELGLHPAGAHWQFAVLMPGGQPMTNLARALVTAEAEAAGGTLPDDTDDNTDDTLGRVAMMEGLLRRGPQAIHEWLETSAIPPEAHLLLLVDQFEELFRFDTYAAREDAEAFVNLLIQSSLPEDRRIHVVITMRSEFLGACALIPRLAETLNRGSYLTPRMSRRECQMAIVGPARIVGAQVEDALVNRLLNDLSSFAPWGREANTNRLLDLTRRADQLPVMQHLLNRMWQQAEQTADGPITLTLKQYADLGGLRGALDTHGDEVLAQFQGQDRELVERTFRALVDGPNPAAAIRRPRTLAELAHELGTTEDTVLRLIAPFRAEDCNFLRPGAPEPVISDTVIDISHESLIRQWSRMSAWVEAEARAARDWIRLESYQRRYAQGLEELLSGRALATLSNWWQDEAPRPEWAARYIRIDEETRAGFRGAEDERTQVEQRFQEVAAYLKDSEAEEEREKDRKRRTRRWFQAAGGAVTVLSLAVGAVSYLALQSQQEAIESRNQQRELFTGTVERVVNETTTALEREFQSPTQSKLDTIEFGNQLMDGLQAQRDREWDALTAEERASAEQELSTRWFVESRMSFLMTSVAVKLAGGMLENADAHVAELESLLDRVLAQQGWAPDTIRLGEAERLLARYARLRTDFDKASRLLTRAENRLPGGQSRIDADAVHRADLLHERAMIHYDRQEIGAQLLAHAALRAHLDPLLIRRAWDRVTDRDDPTLDEAERTERRRLMRGIYLASVRSGMAALVALEQVDGHVRGDHDPERLLRDVTRWVGWLRENIGLTDPETRMAVVRLSLVQAVASRDFGLELGEGVSDPTDAVNGAVGLVDYDPTNIAFMRHLVHAVLRRAGYALEAGRMEQAGRDIADARTLIHVLRQRQADRRTLLEATAELDFLEWRYHRQARTPGEGWRIAARLRARALYHQETDTLDPSVSARPELRMVATHIASGRAMAPETPDPHDEIDAALEGVPLAAQGGDDRYHALKRRQVIYDSLFELPSVLIGPDRWLGYHERAAAELAELIETAPGMTRWRDQAMRWSARAWLEYWARGGPGDEELSYRELAAALGHAVSLYQDEPQRRARIAYIQDATGFAADLVQMLHRAEDPAPLLPPLEAYASDVLGGGLGTLFGQSEVQLDRTDRPDFDTLVLALSAALQAQSGPGEEGDVIRVLSQVSAAVTIAQNMLLPGGSGVPGVRDDRINRAPETSANPIPGTETEPEPHADPAAGGTALPACGSGAWAFEPLYAAPWQTLNQETCEAVINRDLAPVMSPALQDKVELIRRTALPFYRNSHLLEVQLRATGGTGEDTLLNSYLMIGSRTYPLDGSIQRILEINKSAERLMDNPAIAAAYLRFFLTYVNGSEGAFQIVESVRDIAWDRDAGPDDLNEARAALRPLVVWEQGEGRWRASGSIHYGNRIYHADLTFGQDGLVDMTNDVAITGVLPTQVVLVNARSAGRGIRAFGLSEPGENQLAVNGVNFFDLLGLDEEDVIESLDDEILAVVRAGVAPDTMGDPLHRGWLAEHVALVREPAVLEGRDPDTVAQLKARVAGHLARRLPDDDPLLSAATDLAREAASAQPGNEAYATTLGLALLRTGEVDGAIETLTAVTQDMPVQWMDAWVYLGRAHLVNGDLDRAEQLTRDGLAKEPADRRNLGDLRRFAQTTLDLITEAHAVQ
ncbi:MAG: hypothetical protein AAF409_04190 [Pseudomonadota bacterium]